YALYAVLVLLHFNFAHGKITLDFINRLPFSDDLYSQIIEFRVIRAPQLSLRYRQFYGVSDRNRGFSDYFIFLKGYDLAFISCFSMLYVGLDMQYGLIHIGGVLGISDKGRRYRP